MKLLLFLLALFVAAALVVAELAAPRTLERVLEERVSAAGIEHAGVDAELFGFPVVARALLTGELERVVVTVDDVTSDGVTFDTVRADVRDVRIERSAVVDGEVGLESVGEVVLTGDVTEAEITRRLPEGVTRLTLEPGRVAVTVAGQRVVADVTATAGVIRVEPEALPAFTVPLPDSGELFPCPLSGTVVTGAVRVGCTLDDVPPWLLDEARVRLRG